MPTINRNNVPKRPCLLCGKLRPCDWFCPTSNACWKCRSLGEDTCDDTLEDLNGKPRRTAKRR